MEVSKTVHVEATDQTGITVLGYEVRGTPGGPIQASALRQATGQLVLVAAIGRGVVIAQLPNTFTTTCP